MIDITNLRGAKLLLERTNGTVDEVVLDGSQLLDIINVIEPDTYCPFMFELVNAGITEGLNEKQMASLNALCDDFATRCDNNQVKLNYTLELLKKATITGEKLAYIRKVFKSQIEQYQNYIANKNK